MKLSNLDDGSVLLVQPASTSSLCSTQLDSGSESPSSTNSLAPVRRSMCPVCGGVALNKHFGATSCNACAAFFRRTISIAQKYICAHDNTCKIMTGEGRGFCKYCRFQRCLQNGMLVSAVCSTRTQITELQGLVTGSLLWKIVTSQRATFVNRFKVIIKACGGDQKAIQMGIENPDFTCSVNALISEVNVLLQYMESTGLNDVGLSKVEYSQLLANLYYPWVSFTCIMNTLKNGGLKTNTAYGVDECYMKIEDDVVKKYVRTCSGLLDYELVAKYTKKIFVESMVTVEFLHAVRMEDIEHSTMFHLYALKTANKLFPNNQQIPKEMNRLFNMLKNYFEQNYENPGLRIGNVVLFLAELERLTAIFTEYVGILYLNGYNSVMSKLCNR